MIDSIAQTRSRLAALPACQKRVLVGFDGYIDTIVRPVQQLAADGTQDFFPTIDAFGSYLNTKARRSCSIELARAAKQAGGNAYLFGNALAALGESVDTVGAFGYPAVDPLFVPTRENLRVHTAAGAGYCTAMEFLDGKVLLADNSDIDALDFDRLCEVLGRERLLQLCNEAELLAMMNWSELKGSNRLWRGFLDEIFPRMEKGRRSLFLDLSDCSVRTAEDRLQMLDMIAEMSDYFEVSLSVNANEFLFTAGLLAGTDADVLGRDRSACAAALFAHCRLHRLYLHTLEGACCIDSSGETNVPTRPVKKPLVSTGGGDNFNAGLLYAASRGMSPADAMLVGNAASGYYITRGRSADRDGLLEYLDEWIAASK